MRRPTLPPSRPSAVAQAVAQLYDPSKRYGASSGGASIHSDIRHRPDHSKTTVDSAASRVCIFLTFVGVAIEVSLRCAGLDPDLIGAANDKDKRTATKQTGGASHTFPPR